MGAQQDAFGVHPTGESIANGDRILSHPLQRLDLDRSVTRDSDDGSSSSKLLQF
jgi:hypothetical protein